MDVLLIAIIHYPFHVKNTSQPSETQPSETKNMGVQPSEHNQPQIIDYIGEI